IPVDISDSEERDEQIPASLVEFLSPLSVVVLGYYSLPEQTAPGQARDQFGDESQEELDRLADEFRPYTQEVETVLVFTHDTTQTLERVADDEGCDVVLVPNKTEKIERILVPLRGDVNFDSIADVVTSLVTRDTTVLKLVHVSDPDSDGSGDLFLRGASESLIDRGIDPSVVETEVVYSDDPVGEITDSARNHDVVVMGETEPSIRSILLGEVPERVARDAGVPILLVRHAEIPDQTDTDADAGMTPSQTQTQTREE
ncbi:MAG: universal stress protein, partial [Halobacteria archaeon]|nr:universal stress protein [Halobacteria archaeon]